MAEPYSPLWWVEKLDRKRRERALRLARLRNYAIGDHPVPEGSQQWRDYYRAWQKRARTNYCGLAASSVAERLQVTGFTSGDGGSADADVWQMWKRYRLNADSDLVHHAQADVGLAYVLVGKDRISPESAFQTITYADPADPRNIVAGLKTWRDGSARVAYLYSPQDIFQFRAPEPETWQDMGDLEWSLAATEPNPLGRVPIVPFYNRPTLDGGYLSEFEDAIDVQDRINSLMLHMLTISQSQAFRQRYVKGLVTEDESGNPIDPPFEALVSALWVVEDTDVEFGEFQQVDLSPLLNALKESVTQFVSITGLPPHYVAGDLVNASADALAAAEARLVAKVRARQRVTGEAWEDVMRLAAAWQGQQLPEDLSVLWADPERKTDAQLADAVLKSAQYGVPWEQRMIDRGYTPPQIARMRTQIADEMRVDAERAAMTARMALSNDSFGGPADAATGG